MEQLTAQVAVRSPDLRRTLFWTLGLGAFGLAFSITTTAAYLPPLLDRFTDSGTLIGLVLGAEGVFALALFFAYSVYEPPYRGLYPDLLPPSTYGRAQGIQHVLRGIALGLALVGGGFLLKAWHAAPFVLAAVVTTAACAAPIVWVREDGGHGRVFEGVRAYFA